ncbi:MAG: CopG family transcriptional regulator [Halobacteria archaeon]|nr:CopG family transcriptional regulator [Halobacteria archaeon]
MASNKDKTVSFRVSEETFETLSEISERRDTTLSDIFRQYVDSLVSHDGDVSVVPDDSVIEEVDDDFPPKVKVSKEVLRENERLELENRHLRERLEEYEEYVEKLRERHDGEHVRLGKVDS